MLTATQLRSANVTTTALTGNGDRPWTNPEAKPQIVIEGVTKTFGAVTAVDNVSLGIYQSEMFALVGASGCGKTTLLRMLAGFERQSGGHIRIDGIEMSEVPPHERPVNMMFQSYALFPHMTVESNVGYGLRRLPLKRAERKRRIEQALEMVQLGPLAQRKPHQLSGGQRQRVALARALIRQPKVLLLDEPLSALDKKLREQTQFELMDLQCKVGITFVVVTHDQDEAMALATRIAVMDRGRVIQVGTPSEIYEFPNCRFVADFVGTTNLFQGAVTAVESGLVTVHCPDTGSDLLVDDVGRFVPGQRVWVALRPEKIRLSKQPPGEERINVLRGVVWELGYLGKCSTYQVKLATGKLVTALGQNVRRTSQWTIDWSDEVYMSWQPDAAVILQS